MQDENIASYERADFSHKVGKRVRGFSELLDHGRSSPAICRDRTGSREAEPRRRTARCDVLDQFYLTVDVGHIAAEH
jgi:hypothetical protein